MQVAILGPLEITHDAQPIEINGARLRALLVRLAIDADRVVTIDGLAASLWEDDEPADVANALQSLVSRLRRALPDGVVESRPGGYRLAIAPGDVDAVRFETLARRGREQLRSGDAKAAADGLRDALASWRGPALADVLDAPFAAAPAAQLEEARQSALEDRIAADLALGRHADVVAELESLVASFPLRERLTVLLITALAGSGRPADALAAYERTRTVLADELGADPSPELRDLHAAVLRGEIATVTNRSDAGRSDSSHTRTNLPASLTTFIGRGVELDRITDLLTAHRLVTLVGPGGAGKTRLACEGAARAVDSEPVWLVELAPVTDADDIAQAALGVLDLRDTNVLDTRRIGSVQDALDRLVSALRAGPTLLVLDNCEHLIEGAALFADHLLAHCPELRIVATSREPLGITGEMLCPVPPLGLPAPDATPADAAAFAAVSLFVDRAVAVSPGFVLDDSTVGDVVEVCRRLDGQPLAIELAAARLRTMTPAVLASRLDDRFRLLTGGSRTAVARHRTLHAVVEWSWDLLADAERRLVEVFAVFPAGATADAVHSVAAACGVDVGPHPQTTEDLLAELASKSLVQVGTSADGMPRFRMLETIREFGVEQLAETGDVAAARRAHAAYYLALVEAAEPVLRTSEQLAAIALLEQERDNILAALRFAADVDDADTAVRFAAGLAWFWWSRGSHAEASMWIGLALDVPGEAPAEARAIAIAVHALSSWETGVASTTTVEVADVLAALPPFDPRTSHPSYAIVGPVAAMLRNDNADAITQVERNLAGAEGWSRATLLMLRGRFAENDGAIEQQRVDFQAARALYEQVGDRWGLATMQAAVGELLELEGDLDGAYDAYQAAIALADEIHAVDDRAFMLARLGSIEIRRGDLDAAERQFERASDLAQSTGAPQALAFADAMHAALSLERGDTARARELLARASTRFSAVTVGAPQLRSVIGATLTSVEVADGDLDAARAALTDAQAIAVAESDMPVLSYVAAAAAELAAAEGDPTTAVALLGAAARVRGIVDTTDPGRRRVRAALSGSVDDADIDAEVSRWLNDESREEAFGLLAAFVARTGESVAQTRLR